MKTRARIVAAALAVGLVAGCATPGQNPGLDSQGAPVPTPTYAAAVERVERLISDAAGFLTPTPRLTLVEDLDIPCLDAGAEGSQFNDQVQPGRSYFVGGLPTDRTVAELVSGLTEHWTAQGYRISRDERPQNQTVAVSDPAGFGITVNVNPAGDLALIASSPCVSPEAAGR